MYYAVKCKDFLLITFQEVFSNSVELMEVILLCTLWQSLTKKGNSDFGNSRQMWRSLTAWRHREHQTRCVHLWQKNSVQQKKPHIANLMRLLVKENTAWSTVKVMNSVSLCLSIYQTSSNRHNIFLKISILTIQKPSCHKYCG